jgi:predicted enzyme related to lactoylglutathione lyase
VPIVGRCATLRTMDQADSAHAELSAPGNVFYFVADLAAAAAWYSARLDAEPVRRAAQLVMFDLPGARLTLHEADELNQPGPSGTVPYWTVSDVDATVARWSEHGASAHRGPKTIMTGERLCQMLDPFGNLFGLRQPLALLGCRAPCGTTDTASEDHFMPCARTNPRATSSRDVAGHLKRVRGG